MSDTPETASRRPLAIVVAALLALQVATLVVASVAVVEVNRLHEQVDHQRQMEICARGIPDPYGAGFGELIACVEDLKARD